MMGYTDDELLRYFSDRIQVLADDTRKNKKELIEDIKRWYNGYSWDGENFVYNPFSILSFFTEKQFDNYWFSSGTPTFLTKLIRKKRTDATAFDHLHVSGYIFDSYDIDNMEITSLLFQTGYLTIKKKFSKEDSKRYQLSYPNKEVRDSFLHYLFREYTRKDFVASTQIIDQKVDAIAHDDPDSLFQSIKSLFASIPYNIFTGIWY
jgi:hypothetical protein